MPMSRKEVRGGRVFAFPIFGIAVLLGFYWLLADWQAVPIAIGSALSAMQWPN